MTFKVSFSSQLKSNIDLILIILDESLKLKGNIALLDNNYGGIITDAIKIKSLNKKGSYKSLYYKNKKEIKEIVLYNIGNKENYSIDNADRVGGGIFSSISGSSKSIAIYFDIDK